MHISQLAHQMPLIFRAKQVSLLWEQAGPKQTTTEINVNIYHVMIFIMEVSEFIHEVYIVCSSSKKYLGPLVWTWAI